MTPRLWAFVLLLASLGLAAWLLIPPQPPEATPLEWTPRSTMAPDVYRLPVEVDGPFGPVLARAGEGSLVHPIVAAAAEVYDLGRVHRGRDLALVYTDGRPEVGSLTYAIDRDRTLVVTRSGQDWTAVVDEVEYSAAPETVHVTIERTLWDDGLAAGLRPEDLPRIATIFEYEIDFNTEIREGATLDLVADVLRAEGRRPRLGDVHAIRLVNGDKRLEAVRFALSDEEARYYHPDGTGMKRPFLRSPIPFTHARVTSSFNPKRFHPVLKRRRPHNGTDLGAPTGTPVRTVASGTVTYAGRNGGHGNFVKIQHEGGYDTSYSHLSKILVRKGARVSQGDIIGKVGSTGMSTGPHLHWQMWKNGHYVDAMKTKLPASDPVPAGRKTEFQAVADAWLPKLEAEGGPVEPPEGWDAGVAEGDEADDDEGAE